MRSDAWNSSGDVTEVSGRLEINGVEVPASDLSVTRSIPSNLPDQVAGVGGYTAASGSATVSPSAVISDKSPTPWGAGTPQPLEPVTAHAVSGTNRVPVFSGLVDSTKGSASEPDTDVTLVDISDRLSRTVSMWPLAAEMPPPTTDGSTNKRNIDLMTTYYVDRVLRDCEFYSTPPRLAYCVMSAPLQGSTWPEVGTLWTSNREGTIQNSPWWTEVPWGVAAKSFFADYRPNIAQWGGADGTLSSRAMEISFCAGPMQRNSGRIAVEWNDGAALAVSVTSARSVIAQVRFSADGVPGEWQSIVTATAGELGTDWRVASVRFAPRGDNTMGVSIKADTGVEVGPRASSIPYSVLTRTAENVNVRFTDNAIGGIQVAFPGRAHEATNHVPTAVLSAPTAFRSLRGNPAIEATPAIDLLTEWSKAECAAMWIDEDGVFQWRNRNKFTTGPVAATVSSSSDLLDLTWSHDAQGASRQAIVKYKDVAAQWSKRSRVVVWQGSGQTMEPGDSVEDFVSIPEGEAWVGIDVSPQLFQAETSKQAFNKGQGSWVGFVGYDADGNESGNGKYVGYTYDVEWITEATLKVSQAWLGSVPSGVDHIKLQTRDGGTALKPQWQGMNLPVFRAQTKLMFADATRAANVGGPRNAPDLEHSTGWWVQSRTAANDLAFWLAQQTVKPRPIVEGVEIMPDPRLQLGDKIRVHDTHRTGLRITGVITEIKQSIAAGDHSMSLRLLVTEILADKPTLAEYDAVFSGATLSVRDETWGTSTLAAFDADPLKR